MTEEIFRSDSYQKTCEARVTAIEADGGIRLDRTVFYPEGGGQPGDVGTLRAADGREVPIADTKKHGESGEPLHLPGEGAPALAIGDAVTCEIDWERRHRFMRIHTCMHLLCSLIEGDVTGGGLGDGKARLDFNLPDTKLDKEYLAAELNRLIEEDHPLAARWITEEELEANPGLVRTMSVKPPMGQGKIRLMEIAGIDLQPCGGTHVAQTAEIGAVTVTKIQKKGRQNRRVTVSLNE